MIGKHVQEILIPRLRLHGIDGMHNPPTHQTMPKAVDDGALKPAVLRMRNQTSELTEPFVAWFRAINLSQLGKRPSRHGWTPGRNVAAYELHRMVGVDGRKAIGILQLPAVDETVVAGSTLHVDAEKSLRDALREL